MNNENKLPPEFKKKWIDALRSGEYKQGKCSLYADGAYCCLGVAGILNGLSHKEMLNKSNAGDEIYTKVTPIRLDENTMNTLIGMNDGTDEEQKSFNEIADYIQENL